MVKEQDKNIERKEQAITAQFQLFNGGQPGPIIRQAVTLEYHQVLPVMAQSHVRPQSQLSHHRHQVFDGITGVEIT